MHHKIIKLLSFTFFFLVYHIWPSIILIVNNIVNNDSFQRFPSEDK